MVKFVLVENQPNKRRIETPKPRVYFRPFHPSPVPGFEAAIAECRRRELAGLNDDVDVLITCEIVGEQFGVDKMNLYSAWRMRHFDERDFLKACEIDGHA